MKIGIIGNGFVGKATRQLECKEIEILSYDINPEYCQPKGITLDNLISCDIIFISVPTPMKEDGSCYLGILRSVLSDLDNVGYKNYTVIRSTIPPGTSDELNCYFMPEFLTEKNFENDFINNKNWIFGLKSSELDNDFKNQINKLFQIAYDNKKITNNTVTFLTNKEAEMIKLYRNCFLATKISFSNEMYDFCEAKGICYENVRKIATEDVRIGSSHTMVPGHDGKRGFGGTCFPKDISSLNYEFEKLNLEPKVIKAVIERNETKDRKEKDWENNKGRSVI